ncbi:hypothetical protein [Nitrosomonas europaea]|uniref:hypothetical protein n=1 Tax=Nitrosomonas europaea TaxID=915 RepID=UPI0009449817
MTVHMMHYPMSGLRLRWPVCCVHSNRACDWLFRLRDKREVSRLLDLTGRTPVLHTSRMYPSEQSCTTLMMLLLSETGLESPVLTGRKFLGRSAPGSMTFVIPVFS